MPKPETTSGLSSGVPSGLAIEPAEWALLADILHRFIPDYSVWAFGSRAGGRPKPYSDLDLAIEGPQPLSLDRFDALREAFSESPLPWKVDVVELSRVDEDFARLIRQSRVLLRRPEPS